MDESYIINRIEELCHERGWTHYRLAIESGIPHSTLHNLLKRSTIPTIPSISKICDAFGISLSQFFNAETKISGLSTQQQDLLNAWAALDAGKRELLMKFIQSLI